jgi:hypothetical protein
LYKGVSRTTEHLPDYRLKLTRNIDHEFDNQQFKDLCCEAEPDGVYRNRKLTIRHLILIIMAFKNTLQRELDSFYKDINKADFSVRFVTKSAFFQARSKINPLAFKHLSRIVLSSFYQDAPTKRWKNMRVLACDCTKLMLPRHKTITHEFGTQYVGPNADVVRHMALASILYDRCADATENLVPIDSQIASYDHSERGLLKKHLNYTQKGDLLLLDRGYPAQWLFFLLHAKELDFCIRLTDYKRSAAAVGSIRKVQQQ